MSNPHPAHMALSARVFASRQNPSARSYVQGSEDFNPVGQAARSTGKLTMGSNVFQFYNADIAEQRGGRPNALGKETLGTVYGGRVGEF